MKNQAPNNGEAGDEGLKVKARQMAMYSPEAIRRAYIVDKLIVPHTNFTAALTSFDRSFQLAKEFSVPAGVRVYGPPGSGKSTVIRYFRDSLPRFDLVEAGMGAVAIEMPKSPQVGSVIEAVLTAVDYPFSRVTSNTVHIKRELSVKALQRKGTRILAIDEAHNLFGAGSARLTGEGTPVTNYLRYLADNAMVSLCLVGGPALAGLETLDKYLASRCKTPTELPDFTAGAEWLGLVKAIVKQCDTFDLSLLDHVDQRKLLFKAVEGNLRALKILLIESILVSVDAGQQQLDTGCMAIAFQRVHGAKSTASNPWGK
jgi:hypothetical protein